MGTKFSYLPLTEWQSTRDSLQQYARLIGAVKKAFSPERKHFWHLGLDVGISSINSGPMAAGDHIISVAHHIAEGKIVINRSDNQQLSLNLENQTILSAHEWIKDSLTSWGIEFKTKEDFNNPAKMNYDKNQASAYWNNLSIIHSILWKLKAKMTEESSPIQIFPHHFDLSLTWFSGNFIDGKPKEDLDIAKEQMGFGFSTGDEMFNDAYFYATAYPVPPQWHEAILPEAAEWSETEWKGGSLKLSDALKSEQPEELIYSFYETAWMSGLKHMMG